MTKLEAMNFIDSLPVFGGKDGNKGYEQLLERLGNPQKQLKAIHVAGTNGKGSVCAYVAAALQAKGYKTGLYTSPCLVSFNERIRINGKDIPNTHLAALTEELAGYYKELDCELSQFAFITVLMFVWFYRCGVEYAVIEVGLGGALDPTNVCCPVVSVITPVSLDHTAVLGNTTERIAVQKAGIIKKGVPVVCAPQKPEALKPILMTAAIKGCRMCLIAQEDIKNITANMSGTRFDFGGESYKLKMLGRHQAVNAACAICALRLLDEYDETAARAVESTVWEARLQPFHHDCFVLVDGAHNPAGAKTVREFIQNLGIKNVVLITGMAQDKDCSSVAVELGAVANYVYTVPINSPRSKKPSELLECYLSQGIQGRYCSSLREAFFLARQRKPMLILVCGSLYLAGEFLENKYVLLLKEI